MDWVSIDTETHKDALVVPWESIVQLEDEVYVYVVGNNTTRKVPVTIGQVSGNAAEVFGELEAGQLVAKEGKYALSDGVEVEIISEQVPGVGDQGSGVGGQ